VPLMVRAHQCFQLALVGLGTQIHPWYPRAQMARRGQQARTVLVALDPPVHHLVPEALLGREDRRDPRVRLFPHRP